MKFIRHLLFAVTLLFAGAAFALDLDSAKSQGLVGEQPNGYLGVVKATSEAVELVSDVNEKRRQAYQRIARENGISLEPGSDTHLRLPRSHVLHIPVVADSSTA